MKWATGPLMNSSTMRNWVAHICCAFCLIQQNALAETKNRTILGAFGEDMNARNTCFRYLAAEQASNWQECYDVLSSEIRKRYPRFEAIMPFITEMSVPPEGNVKAPILTSEYGSGPETIVTKISTNLNNGYVTVLFILRKNSDDGKWAIAFVYPSKLSSLFIKCIFEDPKASAAASPH